ncbi:glutathione S-transferase family protein [Sphingomonas sp.]|uniref:glutathione S-transferase family protein n=1 Tax=Sphingomonas sp. TaxID=28214 RepID=UPI001D815383|nr:glutathione S-transferase family protein [Sphingomonas sp.]MBX9796732.1 glutathione S-transferase family protein [Sphingomonas sp.]
MILYGAVLSPYVRKVLAYAREKDITLTLEPVGLAGQPPAFLEASPFRKMPALRDPGADGGRDFCISDSSAIIAYLEAKFPAPALIPTEPMARARTIWFDELADTIFVGGSGKIFFNRFLAPKILKRAGDEALAAQAEAEELPPVCDYLEGVIPASGFLVEDRLTLADIAVASPFVNLAHAECAIDAARWPRLAAYVAAILARPSFAPLVAAEQRMVAALTG